MRATCLLAVSVSAFIGVGCERQHDDETIEIVYWTRSWWGDPAQYQGEDPLPVDAWQRRQIARFEAEHPNVKIDLQIDPGGRGDKIRIAFAAGTAPDVFHGAPDTEFIRWADLGLLEPIDPYLTPELRQDIHSAALETGAYAGKHYLWPLYNHALCVVINRDLFRERGLADEIPAPGEPWTMSAFRRLAEQLTFDRDGDGRTDVYGVGLHTLDANHVFLTTYLINFGARVFDANGRFVLNSERGVAGLEFLREMVDAGVATPGAGGYTYEDVRRLFADQRVAMYLTSAGTLIWTKDQAAKGTIEPFDWGIVPVPHAEGASGATFLTIGSVFVSRQEDQRKRDACMAFAKYLTGPRVNEHFWGVASPRRSTPPPQDPDMAAMMQQVPQAENFMLSPHRMPDRFSLTEEMVRLYQDVFAYPPKATPKQALDQLAARVNGALAAYREEQAR